MVPETLPWVVVLAAAQVAQRTAGAACVAEKKLEGLSMYFTK
jgi:hypothetical protein